MLKQLFLLKTGPQVVKKWGENSDFVKIWEDFFCPKTNFIFHENFQQNCRFWSFLHIFEPIFTKNNKYK